MVGYGASFVFLFWFWFFFSWKYLKPLFICIGFVFFLCAQVCVASRVWTFEVLVPTGEERGKRGGVFFRLQ